MYVALYRKWRPGTFSSLVGQEHISRTLENALKQGKIAHAYLFTGPRGTGKTSTAKILAKALNCMHGPTSEPCNECERCRRINDGTSMDVYEIDAASNRGIDEIRELRESVRFAPVDGLYKVYIIDEVHMLTVEAFNALLKTLEEPPEKVVFVLATTEIHKVPATIQSRCQRYDFKRIEEKIILKRLKEVMAESEIKAEEKALSLIAQQADGGMRDALSLLDQCLALVDEKLTVTEVRELLGLIGYEWIGELLFAIAKGDASAVLAVIAKTLSKGRELRQLIAELITHLREVMVYQAVGHIEENTLNEANTILLEKEAKALSAFDIMDMIKRLNEVLQELKYTTEPRIAVETALLSLILKKNEKESLDTVSIEKNSDKGTEAFEKEDLERISQLEKRVRELTAELNNLKKTVGNGTTEKKSSPPIRSLPTTVSVSKRKEYRVLPLTKEAQNVFQSMMEEIATRGGAISSCFSGSSVLGMDEGTLQIKFKTKFASERAEKNDYQEILTDILHKLTGREMRVEGILERPKKETPPQEEKPQSADVAPPDLQNFSKEEREVIEQAIGIFGDHFVDKEIYDKDYLKNIHK